IMTFRSDRFFFSSRRRHTRWPRDWSSDVCSSDLSAAGLGSRSVIDRLKVPNWLTVTDEAMTRKVPPAPGEMISCENRPSKKSSRSEERRVGKECRTIWARDECEKKRFDSGGED